VPAGRVSDGIEAELRSRAPRLTVDASGNVGRRGDGAVHLHVSGRRRRVAEEEPANGGVGAVGRDEDVAALRAPVGEPRGDSVVVLLGADTFGAELDRVLADDVDEGAMKLGAAKAERRRPELPRHGACGVTDDVAASAVAELHLLDRRCDSLDSLERSDLGEDARAVRPEAQSVADLEVAEGAGLLEDRRVDVRAAK